MAAELMTPGEANFSTEFCFGCTLRCRIVLMLPFKKKESGVLAKEDQKTKEASFKFSGASVASLKHPDRNEDAIFYPIDGKTKWVGVFDGVGGLVGGELASKIAVEAVSRELYGYSGSDREEVVEKIKESILTAHKKINEKAAGSATTATVARLIEDERGKYLVVGSVGDSRAYILKEGELFRLTPDDSLAPDEVSFDLDEVSSKQGLSGELESYYRKRNLITQSLGGESEPNVHIARLGVKSGDKIVLTTDGVHDNLTRSEIEEVLKKGSAEAHDLVRLAKLRSQEEGHIRSKKDDISAVVVQIK